MSKINIFRCQTKKLFWKVILGEKLGGRCSYPTLLEETKPPFRRRCAKSICTLLESLRLPGREVGVREIGGEYFSLKLIRTSAVDGVNSQDCNASLALTFVFFSNAVIPQDRTFHYIVFIVFAFSIIKHRTVTLACIYCHLIVSPWYWWRNVYLN